MQDHHSSSSDIRHYWDINLSSSIELGYSLFPGGSVSPFPSNSWPLLMRRWQPVYIVYSMYRGIQCSAGGVHNGRCNKIDMTYDIGMHEVE